MNEQNREANRSLAQHLGEFKCHKIVRSAEILSIEPNKVIEEDFLGNTPKTEAIIGFSIDMKGGDGERVAAFMSVDWVGKNQPKAGGYFIVYEDGYASYSPKEAFENGYTRIG